MSPKLDEVTHVHRQCRAHIKFVFCGTFIHVRKQAIHVKHVKQPNAILHKIYT